MVVAGIEDGHEPAVGETADIGEGLISAGPAVAADIGELVTRTLGTRRTDDRSGRGDVEPGPRDGPGEKDKSGGAYPHDGLPPLLLRS
jgi:hypothetical protein